MISKNCTSGPGTGTRVTTRPGSVFYGHISDRFVSFYSKVIPASASEAPHVLDRLIYHESSVDIREHATDTAGAVEIISAMFHLFDFRFTPRIRGLADRRLYVYRFRLDRTVVRFGCASPRSDRFAQQVAAMAWLC